MVSDSVKVEDVGGENVVLTPDMIQAMNSLPLYKMYEIILDHCEQIYCNEHYTAEHQMAALDVAKALKVLKKFI